MKASISQRACVLVLWSVLLPLLMSRSVLAQNPGAIYTTTASGTTVNGNIYPDKESVYLNGGPAANGNCRTPGLPDGTYYFQVTDPACFALLSSDPVENRRVTVSGGKIVGTLGNHPLGSSPCPGAKSVRLAPFLDAPNPGAAGVYKVWLTPVDHYKPGQGCFGFLPQHSKTDNFLVLKFPIGIRPLTIRCPANVSVCNDAG